MKLGGRWLGADTEHWIEIWFRIPLWFWRCEKYHLVRQTTTKGWHWHEILVCLDKPKGKSWRWQYQRQAIPLTREYVSG